ncbi:transglutaminase domain-containing protein [Nonomuraea solani]|uniref:transglutaminase domain-containing protein n=1 Tax=Nonomuraea solani TaxID=1144553 RepID=UPI00190EE125
MTPISRPEEATFCGPSSAETPHRDFALLYCSFLRHAGIPARVRIGFADHFGPDGDHAVTDRLRLPGCGQGMAGDPVRRGGPDDVRSPSPGRGTDVRGVVRGTPGSTWPRRTSSKRCCGTSGERAAPPATDLMPGKAKGRPPISGKQPLKCGATRT